MIVGVAGSTGLESAFGVSTGFRVSAGLGAVGLVAGPVSSVAAGLVPAVFSWFSSWPVSAVASDSAFFKTAAKSSGNLSSGWACVIVPSFSGVPTVSAACTTFAPKILAPINTEAAPIANFRIL